MVKKKQKIQKGITVMVSPEAHEKMRNEGYKAMPRRNLREQINFINNLNIDL